ncbi:Molybdate-binding periplasmic protein [Candidatus Terasakiella magnetica]|uniref:Molybdate-binding periplasmic protein n=1 Tax=Candidatus Terasakiella magnetica TaxID=1867952 RepID=A0A1C3RHZ0_9PROT|nr:molybdate ABC transporter substrate-binding protein [Candidatus Terasakiella magnetica]SCA56834.1 Molybdate-binding periplasmic protein [Candidatus Terasakiella magnetica]
MKALFALVVVLLTSFEVWGATVHVAVASNFAAPIKQIAKSFQEETGHLAIISLGSTGKLYAQILHGAPYEVFLAADQKRPEMAIENKLAIAGSRFTYATGKLAMIPHIDLAKDEFSKLSIANPKTAPYGKAAVQTLTAMGFYDKVKAKLIFGENIAQTFQFAQSSSKIVGLVALSQVINKKDIWVIPEQLYDPIAQDAVLIKQTAGARAFMSFLKSDQAKSILKNFGYGM